MAKFKLKSKRATVKRFRATGKGGVKFGRTNKRHLLTGKSANRKRLLRGTGMLAPVDLDLVMQCVPYGLPK